MTKIILTAVIALLFAAPVAANECSNLIDDWKDSRESVIASYQTQFLHWATGAVKAGDLSEETIARNACVVAKMPLYTTLIVLNCRSQPGIVSATRMATDLVFNFCTVKEQP